MQDAQILYIRIPLSVEINETTIHLGDIATMYCKDETLLQQLKKIILFEINSKKFVQYSVSILKIIKVITEDNPNVTVVNLGEEEFLVNYKPKEKVYKVLEYSKTIFIAFVILFGSAFSIMTFNTDVSVPDVFRNVHKLIMGNENSGKGVIELAYCIGLPTGIIVFFNHFSMKKVKKDPTPIQIEMRKYEKDVQNAMLSNASREGNTIDVD